ncbi:MAG: glycoside hydrolase family 3 C-terminal domain-containing protein [Anaerolineaceae bacterium]|nr:glycoside hydrolase family 3 C-terminal domain-containing protein [Anaerolineaceae bacterium]
MKIKYVAGTQPDESITPREAANRKLAGEAASEGIVLLENDGSLPLKPGKIALYGSGAISTIKGGTGSGEVNERYSVNIADGLRNAGFIISSERWLNEYEKELKFALDEQDRKCMEAVKQSGKLHTLMDVTNIPFVFPLGPKIDEEDVRESDTDTAIYVVARQAGESGDKKLESGDYDLYPEEAERLGFLSEHYAKTILVINSGSSMDLTPVENLNLSAVIYFCQQGEEGGNALADILAGTVSPSGKLTDTWARSYSDIPFGDEFSYLNGDLEHEYYHEGIYVGYRYFDTFRVKPRYAFGYGLSYSTFDIRTDQVSAERSIVHVSVTVTNTGGFAGKEVVQIYLSCPSGKLDREYQMLAAFAKTSLLSPGEKETLTLSFDLADFAAFDTVNAEKILEKGSYFLRAGSSSADTYIAAELFLPKDVVVWKGENLCGPRLVFEELKAEKQQIPDAPDCIHLVISPDAFKTQCPEYSAPGFVNDRDVQAILRHLSLKDLIELCVGYGFIGMFSGKKILAPGTVGRTTDRLFHKGLVNVNLSDGPAGLRLMRRSSFKWGFVRMSDYLMSFMKYFPKWIKKLIMADPEKEKIGYQYCTAFPVETSLAQTWNTELCRRVGRAIAEEMNAYNVTYWLAPAMNIHRNPLCGRNFEYYSEDPLLTGKIAAAVVSGVQSETGTFATIKHFACNNQEDNRNYSDSILSERALREIYLKGFEICIRESHPRAVMSSYNKINGTYAPNNYGLLTDILRNEWGFDGIVMTDWNATNDGKADDASTFSSGNDLIMPGGSKFRFALWKAVFRRSLSRKDLERSASRIIRQILDSNVAKKYPPEMFR